MAAELPALLQSNQDFVATSLFQFLSTSELSRAAAVCKSWQAAVEQLCAVRDDASPRQALTARYWSRLEASTRRDMLQLADVPRWRPAFREASAAQQQQDQEAAAGAAAGAAEAEGGVPQQQQPAAYVPCLFNAARQADAGLGLDPPSRLGVPDLLEQVGRCCGVAGADVLRTLRDPCTAAAAAAASAGGDAMDSDSDGSKQAPTGAPGFWGSLLLAILLAPGGHGLNRLVEWLWAQSEQRASGSAFAAPLARRDVAEFLAAAAVLLRLQEWRGELPEAAAAAHDALVAEMQQQQTLDVHRANMAVKSVPQWRTMHTPLPSSRVRLPAGVVLTTEQQSIIQTIFPFSIEGRTGRMVYDPPLPVSSGRLIRIQALAGCGKTSTLKAIAQAHPKMRFLYTAFNRLVVDAAADTFPPNVEARTTHSLALRDMRPFLAGRKLAPLDRDIEQQELQRFSQQQYNQGLSFAAIPVIRKTVEKFCTSEDDEITEAHLPPAKDMPNIRNPPNYVEIARHLWHFSTNLGNRNLSIGHNTYLKLWALRRPMLTDANGSPYDAILVDEAQDINGVTARVLLAQPGHRIFVGDSHQHIYSFNHCTDLLDGDTIPPELLPPPEVGDPARWSASYSLSSSFRLGPEVAAAANRLLRSIKGEHRLLMGLGEPKATVYRPYKIDDGLAYYESFSLRGGGAAAALRTQLAELAAPPVPRQQLCFVSRLNAGWFEVAANIVRKAPSLSFCCTALAWPQRGGQPTSEFFARLEDVYLFFVWCGRLVDPSGRRGEKRGRLKAYNSPQELEMAISAGHDQELRGAIRLCEKYGAQLLRIVEDVRRLAVRDERDAAVVLTTAHKFKGREAALVQLADDFVDLTSGTHPDPTGDIEVDEYNLTYVGVTRAQKGLVLPEALASWLTDIPPLCATLALRDDSQLRQLALGGGAAAEEFGAAAAAAAAAAAGVGQGEGGAAAEVAAVAAAEQPEIGNVVFFCRVCHTSFRLRPLPLVVVFGGGSPLCRSCTRRTMFAQLAAGEPAGDP